MTNENALLSLQSVGVKHEKRVLLNNIDLHIMPKEIVTIIGPNGAGKSTLLRVALGLMNADSGRIVRKKGLRIGYMPQRMTLNPLLPLTVERFLGMAVTGKKRGESHDIESALARTGVAHLQKHSMQNLSGGETQRVLLSRALLAKPKLLALDEPAQGVDITGQTELYELITQLRDELSCAVLMVSHDLHWVMAKTDTVICLNQHVCCHGHPEKVSNDPAYLQLFGRRHAEAIALYHHDHDHRHTVHGDIECDHHHD
ncbi:zinc ABC transporter ATP-binding protein ZnuC [Spongiibacter sp. KMU-158]|uniref:Zinc ABC transporter ATP-binding protein ZnuC n=1 Tax=Spongiibacter pelagi TaxID=2760804 RepID=A0A927GVM4_9GAMM|nr:zinc ABC transporter ATP-binding protein ZnuC [Spongiibacter pelagi]MBD2857554.1 zinc ABC transporter ATP-binding protein ZnuC [Spongiibacter pelagi]